MLHLFRKFNPSKISSGLFDQTRTVNDKSWRKWSEEAPSQGLCCTLEAYDQRFATIFWLLTLHSSNLKIQNEIFFLQKRNLQKMSLKSSYFLQKDLHANQMLANKLARFWIRKKPAGLSLVQMRMILLPIKRDALIPLLADCQKNNPAVFAGTNGMSLRPAFVGDIAQADKFDLELQPVKRSDNSVGIIPVKVRDGWILLTGNSPKLEGLLTLLLHRDELLLNMGVLTGGDSDNDGEGSS